MSYRNTDEGSLLKMLDYVNAEYGENFYKDLPLFQVSNSTYIDWFLEECLNTYERSDIKHFVFITPNDVIEVLSTFEPEVSIAVDES